MTSLTVVDKVCRMAIPAGHRRVSVDLPEHVHDALSALAREGGGKYAVSAQLKVAARLLAEDAAVRGRVLEELDRAWLARFDR